MDEGGLREGDAFTAGWLTCLWNIQTLNECVYHQLLLHRGKTETYCSHEIHMPKIQTMYYGGHK